MQTARVEVDFRVIKATLEMDVLRCKSSEMIEKEIAVSILAYNLVRWAMSASAALAQVLPRALSFAGAKRLLASFCYPLGQARAYPCAMRVIPQTFAGHEACLGPRSTGAAFR